MRPRLQYGSTVRLLPRIAGRPLRFGTRTKHDQTRNFKKYISVAHKDNNEDVFLEVPLLPCFVFSYFPFLIVFILLCILFLT